MEPTPDWKMIFHHLEAASSLAQEGELAELQQKIEAVKEEAGRAFAEAGQNATLGAGSHK